MTPQTVSVSEDGRKLVNGVPQGKRSGEDDLRPVGHIVKLPGNIQATGPLGPLEFLATLRASEIVLWSQKKEKALDGTPVTVYVPRATPGSEVLKPGNHPMFKGLRGDKLTVTPCIPPSWDGFEIIFRYRT